jgi:hypothetical protein
MKLLPEGSNELLAPAAALPALSPRPPPLLVVVDLLVEEPMVKPLAAEPPVTELPLMPLWAVPMPLWANAIVLVSTSAVANPIAVSFMPFPLIVSDQTKIAPRGWTVRSPIFTSATEVAYRPLAQS